MVSIHARLTVIFPVLHSLSFTCTIHVSHHIAPTLGVYINHVAHTRVHTHCVPFATIEPVMIDQFPQAHSCAFDHILQSVVLAVFHTAVLPVKLLTVIHVLLNVYDQVLDS